MSYYFILRKRTAMLSKVVFEFLLLIMRLIKVKDGYNLGGTVGNNIFNS